MYFIKWEETKETYEHKTAWCSDGFTQRGVERAAASADPWPVGPPQLHRSGPRPRSDKKKLNK